MDRNARRPERPASWLLALAALTAASLLLAGCGPGSSRYVLQFGKDFKPGLSSVDDLGISIVLAIDVSGSMGDPPAAGGGSPKYVQAAQALQTIAGYLEDFASRQRGLVVRTAVLRFSSAVQVLLPLTTLDEEGAARLGELVADPDNFAPNGQTAIGSALEAGSEILAQSGTIMRSLVVVTDGENNVGVAPSRVMDAIYANRNSATTPQAPVATSTQLISFIGFDTNSSYFQGFQERGARVTSASDQAGLEKNLKELLEADITKLEAPALK